MGTFSLRQVLDAGLVTVKGRASRTGIEPTLDAPVDAGSVEADERKVKQVPFNLLTNAVKFTPEGDTVSACARRLDGCVQVAVTDIRIEIARPTTRRGCSRNSARLGTRPGRARASASD